MAATHVVFCGRHLVVNYTVPPPTLDCDSCALAVPEDLAVNNPATSPATSPASRRWRLIYTLLKNPQLILLRKHNLSSQTAQQVALKACNMALQARSTGGIPDIEVVPSEDC